MTTYTRLNIIGAIRRATMVVPTHEPVSSHLAPIADAVAEPHSLERLALVDLRGVELDTRLTLAELGVLDGAAIRLVRGADVPAPPEVTDVTDVVADERAATPSTWSPWHRVTAGAVLSGLGALAALLTLATRAEWLPLVVWAALVGAAVVFGLLRRFAARTVLTGAAVGAGIAAAPVAVGWVGADSHTFVITISVAVVMVWTTLGLGFGWGGRSRSAAAGAFAGVLLASGVGIALAVGAQAPHTFAVTGVIAVLGLGLVPTVALALSGVTRLDDVSAGTNRVRRATVAHGVNQAYATMTWTVAAFAVPLGASALFLLATGELWPQLVGAALVMIAALRTRVLPLAAQGWMLWVAAVASAVVGTWISGDPLLSWLVGAVVVGGALVLVLAQPPAHTRIRMRRWGDLIEALCAIAVVPCVIGLFGVYSFMLGVFQ